MAYRPLTARASSANPALFSMMMASSGVLSTWELIRLSASSPLKLLRAMSLVRATLRSAVTTHTWSQDVCHPACSSTAASTTTTRAPSAAALATRSSTRRRMSGHTIAFSRSSCAGSENTMPPSTCHQRAGFSLVTGATENTRQAYWAVNLSIVPHHLLAKGGNNLLEAVTARPVAARVFRHEHRRNPQLHSPPYLSWPSLSASMTVHPNWCKKTPTCDFPQATVATSEPGAPLALLHPTYCGLLAPQPSWIHVRASSNTTAE